MFHGAVTAVGNGQGRGVPQSRLEEERENGKRVSLSDGGAVRVCGGDTCPADGRGDRSGGGQGRPLTGKGPPASCILLTEGVPRPLLSHCILNM